MRKHSTFYMHIPVILTQITSYYHDILTFLYT